MRRLLHRLAKAVLQLFPAYPSAEYLPFDKITMPIGMRRAQEEFDDEQAGGLQTFFDVFEDRFDAPPDTVLDLGCGFGGRTVAFERRLKAHTIGIDIDSRMTAPALRFARSMGATRASFIAGVGEALPLGNDSIDRILSYDVFEHVEDPERCLEECFRVLKPGGKLFLVFPPYYHPTGAHLEGYVSRAPYTQLIFPESVLVSAIEEILRERGDGYRPQPLRPGDRLHCLNGITIRGFERVLRRSGFRVVSLRMLPLFSRLNRHYEAWRMRYYAWIFYALARIPLARECFTHRVVAVLQKPQKDMS